MSLSNKLRPSLATEIQQDQVWFYNLLKTKNIFIFTYYIYNTLHLSQTCLKIIVDQVSNTKIKY